MRALAKAATDLPEELASAGYQALDKEFVELAGVVALEAGRNVYNGPKLRLTNKTQAQSTLMIIGYTDPVLKTMAYRLDEQKELIIETFNETLNFLEIVAHSYQEAPRAQRLSGLLKQVKAGSDSRVQPSSNPGTMFH